LKFGHHGGNHPVKNTETGKVEITCHNHNFAVDPHSINANEVDLTHVDLNDNTLEGLRHRSLPLFSVQYHPEASPGPHDSNYLFHDFRKMMEEWKVGGFSIWRCRHGWGFYLFRLKNSAHRSILSVPGSTTRPPTGTCARSLRRRMRRQV
jgi:hypothetical protein